MQMQPLQLIQISLVIRPLLTAIVLANFQQEALDQHNYYRQQLHCTSLMTLNASLNTIAQNYAQFLATNNIFNHSGAAGLGENLYMSSSSMTIQFINGNENLMK